jgi:hypothetical protein
MSGPSASHAVDSIGARLAELGSWRARLFEVLAPGRAEIGPGSQTFSVRSQEFDVDSTMCVFFARILTALQWSLRIGVRPPQARTKRL